MRAPLLALFALAACGPAATDLDGGADAAPARLCGDERIEGFEVCDDGNRVSGDGCDLDCRRVERGWICSGEPSVCRFSCGDGRIEGDDVCDDGNRSSGDGCSADCFAIEPGFDCSGEPSRCVPRVVCGDGRLGPGEACDDGNTLEGDGCDAGCALEPGFVCREEPSECAVRSRCGDGHREATEACDDGNVESGDGCDAVCACEPGPDADGDSVPDLCDRCEGDDAQLDADGDGRCGVSDDCPTHFDPEPADFDGDGLSDACDLVDTAGTREVRRADVGFGPEDRVSALAFGDLDGDLVPDLAVATSAGRVGWARGTGDAAQLPIEQGALLFDGAPDALAFGDLDGDGIDDLVGLDAAAGALHVRFGDRVDPGGRARVDRVAELGCGEVLRGGLVVADLDADGFAERLVVGADAGAGAALCVIDGASGAVRTTPLDADSSDEAGAAIAVGDFDGDGDLDVAVADPGHDASGAVELFRAALEPSPTLVFAERIDAGVLDAPEEASRFGAAISTGDLDGDGADDLVIGEPGRSNGAGRLVRYGGLWGAPWTDALERPDGVAGDGLGLAVLAADLDGDGRAEAVAGAPHRAVLGAARAGSMRVRSGGRALSRDRDLDAERLLLLAREDEHLGAALAAADLDGDGAAEIYASREGASVALGIRGNGPLRLGPITAASRGSERSISVQVRSAGRIAFALERDGASEVHDAGFVSAPEDHAARVDVPWPEEAGEVRYEVLFDGRPVARAALPSPESSPTRVRVAVAADFAHYFRPFRPLSRVPDVDAVLLIGDLMYADFAPQLPPDEAAYGERLRLLYGDPHARSLFARRPLAAIWDDHEIWNDFWPNHPVYAAHYAPARAAFDRYVAAHNPAPNAVGALHFRMRLGGVSFFVFDNRSHRSSSFDPDGPTKTMLGAEQRAAFAEWLSDEGWEVGVIVSSVPMHEQTDTGRDAWFPGYATERGAIFDLVRESGREVHVMSGDHHWTGMFEHELGEGVVLREVMTGPLAVDNRPPPAGPITCLDGQHRVFTVLDVDVPSRVIEASYVDADTGETLCESAFGPVFP